MIARTDSLYIDLHREPDCPNEHMTGNRRNLPPSGFARVVDGQMKAEFATREGVAKAAAELKRRFPRLRISVYDALAEQFQSIGDAFELG